jgi:hypothetical protein
MEERESWPLPTRPRLVESRRRFNLRRVLSVKCLKRRRSVIEEDDNLRRNENGACPETFFKFFLQPALDTTMAHGACPETFSGRRVTD